MVEHGNEYSIHLLLSLVKHSHVNCTRKWILCNFLKKKKSVVSYPCKGPEVFKQPWTKGQGKSIYGHLPYFPGSKHGELGKVNGARNIWDCRLASCVGFMASFPGMLGTSTGLDFGSFWIWEYQHSEALGFGAFLISDFWAWNADLPCTVQCPVLMCFYAWG